VCVGSESVEEGELASDVEAGRKDIWRSTPVGGYGG